MLLYKNEKKYLISYDHHSIPYGFFPYPLPQVLCVFM